MKLLTFNEAIATLVTINDWLEANQSGWSERFGNCRKPYRGSCGEIRTSGIDS
jgi:hypothetical protein